MYARPSITCLGTPAISRRSLAAWLLLGLFLLLWQATVAQAASSVDAAQELAGMTAPMCAAVDMDHDDPADFEALPVVHLMAQARPLPQRFEIAIVLDVWGVQPGLPPPRPAS